MKYVINALALAIGFAWYIGAAVFMGWSAAESWAMLVQPHYAVGAIPLEAASAVWVILGTVTSDMAASVDRLQEAQSQYRVDWEEVGLKFSMPFISGGLMVLASYTISGLL